MDRAPHVLETNWKEVEILAIKEKIRAIMDWIEHTDDLLEIFEKDGEASADLRAVASLMKSRKDDLIDKIEQIEEKRPKE